MPFLFGSHERMEDLECRIGFIAHSGQPVLIEGATGTGKEALAELLHRLSGNSNGLTRIICRKSGSVVYPANGNATGELGGIYRNACGTVFLKNIHVLAPVEQEQLLVGLEQISDPPDGAVAGARLVSSATESVDSLVRRGELSAALYHRLSVYRIHLPSLRERRQDIPELFAHMVRRAANGGGPPRPATPRLLDALMEYDWPGNLRELQNIARTYALAGQAEEIIAALSNYSRPTFAGSPALGEGRSLKEQVKGASLKLESEIILRTLERHRWNRRRAAQSLRISYRSLLYKMKNCNLRSEAQPQPEGKRDL